VQQRRHRDMRIVGERVAQRERAMGGQFDHQPLGQRLDDVVLVLLRLGRLAADGDDGALDAAPGIGDRRRRGHPSPSRHRPRRRRSTGASSSGRT
jgi:hypothetical protein